MTALVTLRDYATFRSDGWRRTALAIDTARSRLSAIGDSEALAQEYIAVVLGRRVRVDDASTQPSPFIRDAGFALRWVEIRSGVEISATALPSWLGEWAVAET